MRSPEKHRRPKTVWGDGFAEDGWSALCAVDSWDQVEQDEFGILFPRLVPRDSSPPACLLHYLSECVAVRAWRLRQCHGQGTTSLASMTSEAAEATGSRLHAQHFTCASGLWQAVFGWGRVNLDPVLVGEARAELLFLDNVLRQAELGLLGPVSTAGTTLFAFLSGIHPAYFWPAAATLHERGSAAAWLGILARGRSAMMTRDVADYMLDVIRLHEGRYQFNDRQMAQLALHCLPATRLRAAAEQRIRGRPVVLKRGLMMLRQVSPSLKSAQHWGDTTLRPADQS